MKIKTRSWDTKEKVFDYCPIVMNGLCHIYDSFDNLEPFKEGRMILQNGFEYCGRDFYEGDNIEILCDCDSEYGCSHGSEFFTVKLDEDYCGFCLSSNETGRKYGFEEFGEENVHIVGHIFDGRKQMK